MRQRPREPRPVFKLVMRGYDRRQVDDYLARLSEDADLAAPSFGLVMRGYDAQEVQLYIEQIRANIRQRPESRQ